MAIWYVANSLNTVGAASGCKMHQDSASWISYIAALPLHRHALRQLDTRSPHFQASEQAALTASTESALTRRMFAAWPGGLLHSQDHQIHDPDTIPAT